jgi:MFS family permease
VALSLAVASVLGARFAPRIGTKAVVSTGLVAVGSAFLWISTVDVDSPYATVIVPQMILMGLGMGLISTPATESILLVLPPARAGVGSAVNDATRELGGTLGVAVVGSVFASVYAARLADGIFSLQPSAVLAGAQDSVGTAQRVSAGSPRLTAALQDAFLAGLSTSCVVIGVLLLAGAVAAYLTLPGRLTGVDLPIPAPSMT